MSGADDRKPKPSPLGLSPALGTLCPFAPEKRTYWNSASARWVQGSPRKKMLQPGVYPQIPKTSESSPREPEGMQVRKFPNWPKLPMLVPWITRTQPHKPSPSYNQELLTASVPVWESPAFPPRSNVYLVWKVTGCSPRASRRFSRWRAQSSPVASWNKGTAQSI